MTTVCRNSNRAATPCPPVGLTWTNRVAAVLLALLFWTGSTSAGHEVIVDGVPEVRNGSSPSQGAETVTLREAWRVGGGGASEPQFGRIRELHVGPDGNIYLLESSGEVLAFSMQGAHLRTLRLSDDFRGHSFLVVNLVFGADGNPGLVQKKLPAIAWMSSDGVATRGATHIRPRGGCGRIVDLFDGCSRDVHLVLAGRMHKYLSSTDDRQQRWTNTLSRFGPEGEEEVRYFEVQRDYDFAAYRFHEREEYFPAPGRWTLGTDGRVYLAPVRDEYEIHIYDTDGKLERIVSREVEIPKRSADRMQLWQAARDAKLADHGGGTYELCDSEPAVTRIRVQDDGTMWVLHAASAHDQSEAVFQSYDVFDPRGHFAKEVHFVCEGDGENDALFWVGPDRVVRVTGVLEPQLTVPAGAGSGPVFGREAPQTEVVCYRIVS
jgi:hypothetical protein